MVDVRTLHCPTFKAIFFFFFFFLSKKSVDLFSFQFYVSFRSPLNVIHWFIFVCKVYLLLYEYFPILCVSFLLLIAMEMG